MLQERRFGCWKLNLIKHLEGNIESQVGILTTALWNLVRSHELRHFEKGKEHVSEVIFLCIKCLKNIPTLTPTNYRSRN